MKFNILFVDDNPNLIKGLKRILFTKRKEWDCFFAENGNKALEIMNEYEINVVISDMKMPGMDGAQFLKIVKEKYPKAIRIILSGHADKDMSLRSTQVAHQYLAKPCESQVLISTINKILKSREELDNEKIQDLVTGISELPSMPDLYFKLEKLLSLEDISINDVGNIISQDVTMTAKMLQMVNTAFFGLPTKINNPIQAVNYLGINVIKSLVLCIQIFDRYENKPHLKPYINNLWYHSMLVASNCRELVRGKLKDKAAEEDVYVAGLLHDIGKIILLKSPGYFEDINKLVEKEKLSVFEAEKKLLGTGHDEVGAYLLRLWGLQEEIVNAVMNHHIYNFNNYEINAKSTVFIANKLTHLNINSTDLCKEKNKNFNDFSWYKE